MSNSSIIVYSKLLLCLGRSVNANIVVIQRSFAEAVAQPFAKGWVLIPPVLLVTLFLAEAVVFEPTKP